MAHRKDKGRNKNMTNYARANDDVEDRAKDSKQFYTDLKVPVSGRPQTPNSRAPRAMIAESNAEQKKATRSNSYPNNANQGQRDKAFWDTDASNIDSTTVGSGTQRGLPAVDDQRQPFQDVDRAVKLERPFPEDQQGTQYTSANVPNAFAQQPIDHQSRAPQPSYYRPEVPDNGVKTEDSGFPIVAGDSYPPTTSGNPSTTDVDERRPHPQMTGIQPRATNLPQRGLARRVQLATAGAKPGQRAPAYQQAPPQNAPASMNGQNDVIQNVLAGFSFEPRHPPVKSATRPAKTASASNQPAATEDAPRGHSPPADSFRERERRGAQHRQTQGESGLSNRPTHLQRKDNHTRTRNVASPALHIPSGPQPGYVLHHQAPNQPQRHDHSTDGPSDGDGDEDEDESEAEDRNDTEHFHNDLPVPNAGPYVEEPPIVYESALDYEPPQLFDMGYQDLRAQSFDVDPNAAEIAFCDEYKDAPLPEKLKMLMTLSHEDKSRFFQSLGIDEWEEAGDWFLQRFAETTNKFRAGRQEKRKAVQELEEEISERHNSVSKKRKMTEDALGEMKESGGKVLQGTPKKSRKQK
ncbi:Hypothetical predicted protein [Lecanosticta acicola]|uniref:Extracellular mutant protein 11 C-terminal domain-containing protein n=1 Tax=Lecanosticta acicola TaxID=111012 RepID=A0AAI8Z3U5_9PEZI|nr:Hypothetical predicted protein [Lecanosticta acicola]